jgi:hypothetical protein
MKIMSNNNRFRRAIRYRLLNPSGEISPLFGPWDRTICFSDINKWMQCPGMYLMWKEGDAVYRRALSQEIGDMVHEETAKPVEERLQDTAEIAARLQSVRPEERQKIAQEVKVLIAKAVRVSDKESLEAVSTEHESLMVWYDSCTATFWYAKPDKREVLRNERGAYLSCVDQKTGKWRKRTDLVSAFFHGYVAKMTRALDFSGPVKSIIRYLRDFQGNVLATPDEREVWIGRNLSPKQHDTLYGIQETVKRIDADWKAQSFPLVEGDHCKGCQFRHTCPINQERFAEQLREEAEREIAASQSQDTGRVIHLPASSPVLAVRSSQTTAKPAAIIPDRDVA